MVFTAASRAAIAANDPAYLPKLRFRAAASLVLLVSLGALTFVITYSSNFKSAAFTADSDTWICLPLIVISLIWNLINIAVLAKFKRPLNPFFNLFSHGLLALLFIVVGAIAARAAARANSVINANPYAPPPWAKETGPAFARPITANDGSTVTVTPETVDECPAFASCAEQETWMLETQHRSTIASAGVALFFLCMLADLFLTILFFKDCRIRRRKQKQEEAAEDQLFNNPQAHEREIKHPYNGLVQVQETASQVHLLGANNDSFPKQQPRNDSAISFRVEKTPPRTAPPPTKRPMFHRPKSNGPSLPIWTFSRSNSVASTITSHRSSRRKSKRQTVKTDKELPPVPFIKPKRGSSAAPAPTGGPHEPKSPSPLAFPPPKVITPADNGRSDRAGLSLRSPNSPLAPRPVRLDLIPSSPVLPSRPPKSPVTPQSVRFAEKESVVSLEQRLSPVGDPDDRESFDYRENLLTALPAGTPKLSSQSSRPSSILGIGDMDGLRSLRGALFGMEGASAGSRSSWNSSTFGGSGRSSPWRERAERAERKHMERILREEKEEREKELLEAEAKAHRAAEKMESHFLREEMARLEEKEAMRRKRIQDRVKKLQSTLEDLKRIQDEEDRRQKEREKEEREEDERFEREWQDLVSHGRSGSVDVMAKSKSRGSQKQDSYVAPRPAPRAKDEIIETWLRGYHHASASAPPAAALGREKYSWEGE